MAHPGRFLFTVCLLAGLWTSVEASTDSPSDSNTPSREQLVEDLRQGGLSILFRIPDAVMGGDRVLWLSRRFEQCDEQRMLGVRGQQDARVIGKALKQQSVPLTEILSSEYCRARDSLSLMVPDTAVTAQPGLNDICRVRAATMHDNAKALENLLRRPVDKGNRLIMTHQCNIRFVLRQALTETCHRPGRLNAGEAAIIRPDGTLLGCLSVEDFYHMADTPLSERPAQLP